MAMLCPPDDICGLEKAEESFFAKFKKQAEDVYNRQLRDKIPLDTKVTIELSFSIKTFGNQDEQRAFIVKLKEARTIGLGLKIGQINITHKEDRLTLKMNLPASHYQPTGEFRGAFVRVILADKQKSKRAWENFGKQSGLISRKSSPDLSSGFSSHTSQSSLPALTPSPAGGEHGEPGWFR